MNCGVRADEHTAGEAAVGTGRRLGHCGVAGRGVRWGIAGTGLSGTAVAAAAEVDIDGP